ncbi:mannose-1-phosphate guanylyltransferase/mannose-6-phosphate isomerase [Ideonella sp. BN130291]|uniref:mannose-1-phosphate guanylyltransferase/mannose-6-phosphate isomerase n=1 Tax=Ideonella sp. BN130291 TaxID=3112940 RepID=UPI002E269712|nr:mannose-1-phosphate guanylyltransferase/mannose-6-phosphate isomerase [Ideonella sp. BN130291]
MNSSINLQPVIMAGGSGTRLWPLSRAQFPKQFLSLLGQQSLFQQAALRLKGLGRDFLPSADPIVVGNEEHRFMLLEQLQAVSLQQSLLMLEPCGRNTAPAVTLAALHAQEQGLDPVLVVSPADQTVIDLTAFTAALRSAAEEAASGGIVILGIPPSGPETGFGYIRTEGSGPVMKVLRFVEKPNLQTAQRYLDEGHHFWNSGMFVMRASVWLQALGEFRADILEATRRAFEAGTRDNNMLRPNPDLFSAVPAESVDYAVIEQCPGTRFTVSMVPLAAGWSDLGAWDAVWQVADKNEDGNATFGDTLIADSHNVLIHASSRLVGAVGLEDIVIVETPDAVLVADRRRAQDVKKIVGKLQGSGRTEQHLHRQVHRPWGWYDSIDAGPRFQVKRIMVKPGESLSLQMHHHRAEHWIVVSGTAEVTNGDKVIVLTENQSTYIPLGERHRLANPGKVPLEIIEVQSGSYLGEDDIVRFEDHYGRQ